MVPPHGRRDRAEPLARPTLVVRLAGKMTLTSASGDKVYLDYTGSAPFPGPGTTVIVAHIDFAIVGGTGRFVNATGGGEMTAYITFAGFETPVWPARWVWSGEVIGY